MKRDAVIQVNVNINQQSVQRSKSSLQGFERAIATLGYRAARTSALLDRYLVNPLKRVAQAAVEAENTLSRGLGEVQSLLQGDLEQTTDRMEDFRDTIDQLSVDLAKDATDIAGGLYEYISAFTELPQTAEGFAIAARVAKAGITDTKSAVDLLSSVSLAYGDAALNTQEKIADLSFETVRLAKTHIPELGANVGKVAPVFAAMGVEMEQLYANAATLIGITGNTTEVFTQLRRIVLSMQKPNQTMVRLLAAMGYVGVEAGKDLLSDQGLYGAIVELNKTAPEMGINIYKALGRIQGIMPAMAYQSETVRERYLSMYKAMSNPANATEEALNKVLGGIAKSTTAFDRAKQTMNRLTREFGQKLLPYAVRLLEIVSDLLEELMTNAEFPALDKLLKWIERFAEGVSGLGDKWSNFLVKMVSMSVIWSPLLGLGAVMLFITETFITFGSSLGRGIKWLHAYKKAHISARGAIMRTIFEMGRAKAMTAQLSGQLQQGAMIATDTGIAFKGANGQIRKSVASVGGFRKVLAAFIPQALKMLGIIGLATAAIWILIKAAKKLSLPSQDVLDLAESASEASREVADLSTKLDDLQENGDVEVRIQLRTELLEDTEVAVETLKTKVDELKAARNEIIKNIQDQKDRIVVAGETMSSFGPQYSFGGSPGLLLIEATIEGLEAEAEILQAEITALERQIGGIEVQVDTELVLLQQDELQAFINEQMNSLTFNPGSYEIDIVIDSENTMNKIDDLINVDENPFTDAFANIQSSISSLNDTIYKADGGVSAIIEKLTFLTSKMRFGIYTDLFPDEASLQKAIDALTEESERLQLIKSAAEEAKSQLMEYYNVLKDISNQSEDLANAYIEASQEINTYQTALEDIQYIQEAINERAYPQEVLDRLKIVLRDNKELVGEYQLQQKILSLIPSALEGMGSVEKIVSDVVDDMIRTKELTAALTAYEAQMTAMVKSFSDIDAEQYKFLAAVIADLRETLGLVEAEDPLSSVQSGLESVKGSLADYNEAIALLSGDVSDYSEMEIEYLKDIVEGYEERVKAVKRNNEIMKSMPSTFKGIELLEQLWSDVSEKTREAREQMRSVTIVQAQLREAWKNGDTEKIAQLQETLRLLDAVKDKQEEITSVAETSLFSIEYEGKYESAKDLKLKWSNMAKGLSSSLKTFGFDFDFSGVGEALSQEGVGLFKKIANVGSALVQPMINSFKNIFAPADKDAEGFFGSLFSSFQGFMGKLGQLGMSLGSMILPLLLGQEDMQEVMQQLSGIFTELVAVLGPAIANILKPLVPVVAIIGRILGMMLLPVIEALAPVFTIIAVLLDALIRPLLALLAPSLSLFASLLEFLMPILLFFAKVVVIMTSPLQYLGAIFNWAADTVRTAIHNLSEFLSHPFNARKRDIWDMPDLREAIEGTTETIAQQIATIDEAMQQGSGNEGESVTDNPNYYTELGNTPAGQVTNPYADEDDSGGGRSGASIDQVIQYNTITVNTGAMVGSTAFDEFVLIVQKRLSELREVS